MVTDLAWGRARKVKRVDVSFDSGQELAGSAIAGAGTDART